MHFWGTRGAGILPIATSTGRLLVPLRSAYVNEPRTWGVIGGRVEPGELPEQAAYREFVEETDYDGYINLYPALVNRLQGFTYHNFIGTIEGEFRPVPDWETDRFRWMSLSQLVDVEPKHFGLMDLLGDPKSYNIIRVFAR